MLGYGPEDKNTVMELTYKYGVTEYDKSNAYAQVKFPLPRVLDFLPPLVCLNPYLEHPN